MGSKHSTGMHSAIQSQPDTICRANTESLQGCQLHSSCLLGIGSLCMHLDKKNQQGIAHLLQTLMGNKTHWRTARALYFEQGTCFQVDISSLSR